MEHLSLSLYIFVFFYSHFLVIIFTMTIVQLLLFVNQHPLLWSLFIFTNSSNQKSELANIFLTNVHVKVRITHVSIPPFRLCVGLILDFPNCLLVPKQALSMYMMNETDLFQYI